MIKRSITDTTPTDYSRTDSTTSSSYDNFYEEICYNLTYRIDELEELLEHNFEPWREDWFRRKEIFNYKPIKLNNIRLSTRNRLKDRKRWSGKNFKRYSKN